MVRLAAALALAAGVIAFLAYLHVIGKGPLATLEMRHLREMKDRLETPGTIEPTTFAAMWALPRTLTVAEYSGIERRAVSLVGIVRTMLRAADGDLHLEVAPETTVIATAQTAYVTAEITPGWRGRPRVGEGWSYDRLLREFRPDRGGATPWRPGPARVRISGWLLEDRDGDVLLRMLHRPLPTRPTDWEIHPVTKIERWDDSLAAWIEVRR